MDLEYSIKEAGLTSAESKIYVALLKLGSSKAGKIIQSSNLQSSVVYNGLKSLIELGLVSYTNKGKQKTFSASDPKNLLEIMHEKENKIAIAIPILSQIKESEKSADDIFVLDGINGVKAIFYDILRKLNKNEEQLVMGISDTSSGFNDFIRNWDKRRIKKRIKKRVLISENQQKWFDYYSKQPLTSIKKSRSLFDVSLTINVYGKSAAIIMWGKRPTAILIERKGIAENFRRYYEALWAFGSINPNHGSRSYPMNGSLR